MSDPRRARCPECGLIIDLAGEEPLLAESFPEHMTDTRKGLRTCTGGSWLVEDEDREAAR